MSNNKNKEEPAKSMHYQLAEGNISHFSLTNKNGMVVKILNYGATITHIIVPDKDGKFDDIALGFDSVEHYLRVSHPYFGCIVGRYANRIANAQFTINDETFKLEPNNNGNSIHGGKVGFNKKIWNVVSVNDSSLVLFYESKDGEEGYPGNLKVHVTYTVTSDNELIIDYSASTDKATAINLTNHSYFNLSGAKSPTILDHQLYINAKEITEADEALIPTGKIIEIAGGPLDFLTLKKIGQDINQVPGGYDHNYVLNKDEGRLSLAAEVIDPLTGRGIEVRTTKPGMQLYTANFLNSSITGKSGIKYPKYGGFCLETQFYPDSPNHPEFPSAILNPDDKYEETTIYKFFVKE
jgi:aldose 1-epimerase